MTKEEIDALYEQAKSLYLDQAAKDGVSLTKTELEIMRGGIWAGLIVGLGQEKRV